MRGNVWIWIAVAIFVLIAGTIFLSPAISRFFSGIKPIITPSSPVTAENPPALILPDGFAYEIYAAGVPGARVITRDPQGALLVSQTSEGKVVALPDRDGDRKADAAVVVLHGLKNPHGLLVLCAEGLEGPGEDAPCTLYVAEENAVRAYDYDASGMKATLQGTLAELPTKGGGHFTRSLLLDPETGDLLVSVGSSCNVCDEGDERRAAILSVDQKTNKSGIFARGLRNTVFMTLYPVTGKIWGTDMGRDLLGDDLPPDEINIIAEGADYGWPRCYGENVPDTVFDRKASCAGAAPAHIGIPAHSAPLGLAFIPEEGWPEEYWFDLLVAYHGSWNRSTPTGYKIVRIELDPEGNPSGPVRDFMTGFMNEDGAVVGRPAGLLIEPGGVLFISDDRAGVIYRVFRTEQAG